MKKNKYHESGTGEYVSEDFAKANKGTTQAESEVTVEQAIKALAKALKKDKEFYFAWQSNIAMPLYDELRDADLKPENLHNLSNKAAIRFLDYLIGTTDKPKADAVLQMFTGDED